jgi:hypothetical protein
MLGVLVRRFHHPATFAGIPAALRRLEKSLKSRRFPADEERLFERFFADRFYPQSRFGVAFGFLAWSSFVVWDGLGFPALLPELAMIRFGVVAPVIGSNAFKQVTGSYLPGDPRGR